MPDPAPDNPPSSPDRGQRSRPTSPEPAPQTSGKRSKHDGLMQQDDVPAPVLGASLPEQKKKDAAAATKGGEAGLAKKRVVVAGPCTLEEVLEKNRQLEQALSAETKRRIEAEASVAALEQQLAG